MKRLFLLLLLAITALTVQYAEKKKTLNGYTTPRALDGQWHTRPVGFPHRFLTDEANSLLLMIVVEVVIPQFDDVGHVGSVG